MTKTQILSKKLLPHNFLAEKMIIRCLLINPELINLTIKTLTIETFYFKNHQEIYRSILFMSRNNLIIDTISLTLFLQEQGLLKKIGGIQVLLDLLSQVPNLVNLKKYVQLVNDKFFRRCLIKFGYKLINSSYITNIALERIFENIENELFSLNRKNDVNPTITSAQILNNIFIELKNQFLNPRLLGLSSGFSNLDTFTQGFQISDLIIIAGRPSIGKTALSLNLVLNSIKISRSSTLFFSLEMSKEQIMYRILSLETDINQTNLKNGKLYSNDWKKLTQKINLIAKLPLFIDDTPNLTIQTLRSQMKKINLQQSKISLVIIDYLQLMQSSNSHKETRAQELSQITKGLKNLAREFAVPIIALSQLNREVNNRIGQIPVLSDLRESGSIEQDADLVLLLYPSESKKISNFQQQKNSLSYTNLIIAKHRNGPTGTIQLVFDKTKMKFQEIKRN